MILYVSCPDATPSGLSIMPKQSGPHPLQRPVDRLYARHLCMLCVKYENRTCKLNCKSISTKNKDLPTQTEIISTIYEKKLPFQSLSMALSFLLPLQYASSRVSSQTRKPWGSGFEWSDMKSWESGSEWSDMLRPLDRWGVGSVRFTVVVSDGSSGAENGVFFFPRCKRQLKLGYPHTGCEATCYFSRSSKIQVAMHHRKGALKVPITNKLPLLDKNFSSNMPRCLFPNDLLWQGTP